MTSIVIQTERLILRKINQTDYNEISKILQDIEVMYAWEKTFSDEEVQNWINKNLERYNNEGFSYFLAINKENNETIGVMGPLIENIEGKDFIGVAYILNKEYWKMGYATEGIDSCINYAFTVLDANEVIAQIRPENINSRNVAQRLNMKIQGEYTKIYDKKEMLHLIYSIKKDQYFKL